MAFGLSMAEQLLAEIMSKIGQKNIPVIKN